MTPTARTLKYFRDEGLRAQVVERFIPQARRRVDLFGCIDIVIIESDHILGVQACADGSHAARLNKSLLEPALRAWLEAGAKFCVVSWGKKGARGKRKLWVARRTDVELFNGSLVVIPLPVAS